jgi:hypothetical protein
MKTINHDNWLLADNHGKSRVTDASEWRKAFLSLRIDPTMPPDVVRMFEKARGSMLYSYFFHPLMAMGIEQCYRALESGARARCAQAGLPVDCVDNQGKPHPLSYSHNLRALAKAGLINDESLKLWQQARELRDWVMAPANQAALTLDHGVIALSRAAELLGRLFQL